MEGLKKRKDFTPLSGSKTQEEKEKNESFKHSEFSFWRPGCYGPRNKPRADIPPPLLQHLQKVSRTPDNATSPFGACQRKAVITMDKKYDIFANGGKKISENYKMYS